jgi:hypothetical protein
MWDDDEHGKWPADWAMDPEGADWESRAAVIAHGRKLLIVGDPKVEQDDAYIVASFGPSVRLKPEAGPVAMGFKCCYCNPSFSTWSQGMEGFTFGLTSARRLNANRSGPVPLVFNLEVTRKVSFFSSRPLTPDEAGAADEAADAADEDIAKAPTVSAESNLLGDGLELEHSDNGGFAYTLVVVWDPINHQVRAVVESPDRKYVRLDRMEVHAAVWPSPDEELVPVVKLNCEDFGGFSNVDPSQCPLSVELMTDLPEEAMRLLLPKATKGAKA